MKIYADKSWVTYLLDIFFSRYPVLRKEREISISYGINSVENALVILKGKKCKRTLEFDGENIPIYHVNTTKSMTGEVLSCYQYDSTAISFDKNNNIIYMNADVLKTSFLLLSRIHEKETPVDNLGRFQAKYSLHKNHDYPLVNEYFRILYNLILTLKDGENEEIKDKYHWPNNAPYAVCLTHDVDNIYKWWPKKILSYIFKKRKISELFHSIGKGEYWTFDDIMDLETRFGFKSTFFFLTTKRDLKPRYNINKLKKTLRKLDNNGWEIGLHTGFNAFDNIEKMRAEKKKLEQVLGHTIQGVRNHYLRINVPNTWKIQSNLGFKYDSTLGFRETIGFRPGYCYPYHPYDFMNERKIDIVELPMTIMDSALLSSKNPKREFNKLLEKIKKYNGLLVINWHNASFDEKEYPERLKLYAYMLKQFKKDRAYIDTCMNITSWWKEEILL